MKLWLQLLLVALAKLLRRLADKISPQTGLEAKISELLASKTFEAVLKAVKKQNSDPVLASAPADTKRAEALEWAEHYAGKKLARADSWETRFLMELAVGVVKGKLHKD